MKIMSVWNLKAGAFSEAVRRFLAGEAAPPEGVTLLGRWHCTDFSAGFSLYETNDPAALYAGAARWADILDFKSSIVVEDDVAGPALAALKK
jgi:hypothetical protein